MRVANRTKDYTQIDALIRENIPKFLYNNGEGKLVKRQKIIFLCLKYFLKVTISEIVRRRNNTFSKVKNLVATAKSSDEEIPIGYFK
jgi:predicted AAA+ superfamily ATPase